MTNLPNTQVENAEHRNLVVSAMNTIDAKWSHDKALGVAKATIGSQNMSAVADAFDELGVLYQARSIPDSTNVEFTIKDPSSITRLQDGGFLANKDKGASR